ncbi:Hypothetical predicted protein [Pelobates cultripes]|uniref:Uncharacterized protein n=1 Tax=Pelobates cultripes TaxID=61616 RepID=A0AAD1TIE4_PELCU|nr:Hypothetical predicted protein [Pelobates cultripes]
MKAKQTPHWVTQQTKPIPPPTNTGKICPPPEGKTPTDHTHPTKKQLTYTETIKLNTDTKNPEVNPIEGTENLTLIYPPPPPQHTSLPTRTDDKP